MLARALRARQHDGSSEASFGGASMCPTGDRPSGVDVRGVPSQEAMTHLISDEGKVPGETTLGASAR
jgi:hypothetical protein